MSELPDRISETFSGCTVFISGATGFIGQVLVEKLLRATDVKTIYLLIRRKRGKTPYERLQDIFDDNLFHILKENRPEAIKKCLPISGDVAEIDLGISKQDRDILRNEVNFIFHSAATTRFDEPLKYSVQLNTRGTKFMLELAEECLHLKLFIHISTAYAFPKESVTYDKFYDPPADPHEVLKNIIWIEETDTKQILKDSPNTYTVSKALAEALVHEKIETVPSIIVRPSIVLPTFTDPFPGWCNNIQGPIGLLIGTMKGAIRSLHMDSESYANFMPVDCVVSGVMVMCWNRLTTKDSPTVFNACIPEKDLKISFGEIWSKGHEIVQERVPFNSVLWYPGGTLTKSKLYNDISFVIFQLIPAIIIDLILILCGQKPILYNIQMKIRKGIDVVHYYTTKSWNFDTNNLEMVRQKLNAREKKMYTIQSDIIDVKEYLTHCFLYMRRYIFKETDEELPSARRNMKRMYAIDLIMKVIFFGVLTYYLYSLLLMPFLNARSVT